ncbi:prolyl-tRNA synthetase [Fontibacillus panacisegetis]|uniref:Proline--tRNA ligase n=1 Tax=Fontibacillus panacisegetis TaxID=670482 RepID=A0A1G7SBT1_9BACL|nr:proline--tRNA ligase [Fontibacillus panacisegetis]SDG20525.1 prolyl-tRNA synthetase [Fontibacillus panacisegetis]
MRQSKLLLNTLREAPSEAEVISHQLMLRGGFIRQLAAGIYSYLPLGRRVLRKVEQIIREEMDRTSAQEILMPAMQPTELWKESGRYSIYGPELIRLHDRHDREFALGPTHEEVVTALVRNEVSSYRKLPVTLYQIQTKFRDERRPRSGLLRGREFLMKDAYSFDTDWSGLDESYRKMYEAYHQIFNRIGLNFRAVEADAGAIGGEGETHEFMALTEIGEDTIVTCNCCDYIANLEKAESRAPLSSDLIICADRVKEKVHTPNARTIEELTEFLNVEKQNIVKTMIYLVDGNPVAVLVRGDHEVNEVKVKNYFGAENIEIADDHAISSKLGVPVGFIGPVGLQIPLLVDVNVVNMPAIIVGANEQDFHYINIQPHKDFAMEHVGDFRNVSEGDSCPRCEQGNLQFYRGIEIGHVFKLGTKYSEKLGATYLDSSGKEQTMIMGCYGIGVSRILSAVVEQSHDEHGMVWPISIAPFHVHLVPISVKDEVQMNVVEQLYQQLSKHGVEVLVDDREERPGVKFKDSDLIGIPIRIVIGKDAAQGLVEFVERGAGHKTTIEADQVLQLCLERDPIAPRR